ncbi:MAG: HAMP domain-containing sensor histidine kinase [Planctomycetota bacterium]|nr:HAMP domain-containing sensor histidine kinase [Planctomycetota bacterium]
MAETLRDVTGKDVLITSEQTVLGASWRGEPAPETSHEEFSGLRAALSNMADDSGECDSTVDVKLGGADRRGRAISTDYPGVTIFVSGSLDEFMGLYRSFNYWLIAVGLMASVLATLVSRGIAKRVAGPIQDVISASRQLARGDFSQQVAVRADDEVGRLVHDLLDLSKLDAGKMTYAMTRNDLEQVVDTSLSQFSAVAEIKAVRLNFLPVDESVDTTAVFDNRRLTQVVKNLLSNAVKFAADSTSITVSITEGLTDLNGEEVPSLELTVADEGAGIPEEELESIFDAFTQSKTTELGAAHKGRIWAENNPDGGARFSFTVLAFSDTSRDQRALGTRL